MKPSAKRKGNLQNRQKREFWQGWWGRILSSPCPTVQLPYLCKSSRKWPEDWHNRSSKWRGHIKEGRVGRAAIGLQAKQTHGTVWKREGNFKHREGGETDSTSGTGDLYWKTGPHNIWFWKEERPNIANFLQSVGLPPKTKNQWAQLYESQSRKESWFPHPCTTNSPAEIQHRSSRFKMHGVYRYTGSSISQSQSMCWRGRDLWETSPRPKNQAGTISLFCSPGWLYSPLRTSIAWTLSI